MAYGGVKGGAAISAALRNLGAGVTEPRMRAIRRKALEPMQADARDNFKSNGSYVSGVIPGDIVIADTGQGQTSLGMTGMGAKLGHIVEFGSAPHEQPNRHTYHPGAEPKPFMRPAFESRRSQTIKSVSDEIADLLGRIAKATSR